MKGGRASRFAFDPAVVVAFVDAHTTVRIDGNPRRLRRYLNGHEVHNETTARTIRRWRNHTQGCTHTGVASLLARFDFTIPQFTSWAETHNLKPVLRGTIPTKES